MKGTFMYVLVVGVPGVCLLIAGAANDEYSVAILGGVLLITLVYGLHRKHAPMTPVSDGKQRLSFILAGVIGASLAVNGLVSARYWLAGIGTVLVIGSLLQLYRTTLDGH